MNMTYPIKNKEDIEEVKDYFRNVKKCHKSYLMFIVGISSALRISDILQLKIKDIYEGKKVREHITIKEKKTGKTKRFAVSPNLRKAIEYYIREEKDKGREINEENYLFYSREGQNKPITRQRAVQILTEAMDMCGLGHINLGSHGLRKTFSYHAWKSGVDITYLMRLLNHSSQRQVLAYIAVESEELDNIYISLNL